VYLLYGKQDAILIGLGLDGKRIAVLSPRLWRPTDWWEAPDEH
jgi:hypothetical protein